MQRPNAGMTNEFEVQDYDASNCIEGGANEFEQSKVKEALPAASLKVEIEKMKAVLDTILYKGFGSYWAMQTTASKVTHCIFGFISAILSLNFLMATYAHSVWDRAMLGHHLQEDEIMVLYCQTQGCGCENGVLHRVHKLINEHFAGDEASENVKIYTQLYPGAPLYQFFSRFLQLLQVFFILTIFFGPMVCRKIYGYGADAVDKTQIRYPYFVEKLAVGGCMKKILMFLLCFIGINICVALMTITGAFEIYHGSDIVFSSLDSKRMVTPRDLMESFPRLDGQSSPLLESLADKLDVPVGHMH